MFRGIVCSAAFIGSVLATAGDEVPFPAPVVNYLVSNGDGFQASLVAEEIAARDAQLAALRAATGSVTSSIAAKTAALKSGVQKAKSFLAQNERLWDIDFEAQVEQKLRDHNCPACIETFRHYSSQVRNETLLTGLSKIAATELSRAEHVLEEEAGTPVSDSNNTMALQSFLAHRARKLKEPWNPLDKPCTDAKTCELMSLGANKCNFGRISTLAVYSAVNIATHIFSAVVDVLCLCLHVYTQTLCVIAKTGLPFCQFPNSLWSKLKGQSESIWEAVKARTKACRVQGHMLIASM